MNWMMGEDVYKGMTMMMVGDWVAIAMTVAVVSSISFYSLVEYVSGECEKRCH